MNDIDNTIEMVTEMVMNEEFDVKVESKKTKTRTVLTLTMPEDVYSDVFDRLGETLCNISINLDVHYSYTFKEVDDMMIVKVTLLSEEQYLAPKKKKVDICFEPLKRYYNFTESVFGKPFDIDGEMFMVTDKSKSKDKPFLLTSKTSSRQYTANASYVLNRLNIERIKIDGK